jgi:hypothetical protein
MCSALARYICVSIQRLCNRISEKRHSKNTLFSVPVLLITMRMKMDYAQRTICITSTRHPPAELNGTGIVLGYVNDQI